MKKEGVGIVQEVEKKYGLNKCKKTEFVKQMIREFAKYERKLAKIENYETMRKEGKELNKEMLELIEKRPSFVNHLKILKNVMDTYIKTQEKQGSSPEVTKEDIKAEIERQANETRNEELRRLSHFFVIAQMLKEKDHISPTPLTKVPQQNQEEILSKYNNIVTLSRNKEITMLDEAGKLMDIFNILMLKDNYIESVMSNISIAGSKFKINEGPEQEFVMLQPADKLEMSEQVAADTPTQTVPVKPTEEELPLKFEELSKPVKEVKDESAAIKEKKAEKMENVKEEGKKANEPKKKLWTDRDEEENPSHNEKQEQEDEFEIAMTKAQKREMNAKKGGRGQRRGGRGNGKFKRRDNFQSGESYGASSGEAHNDKGTKSREELKDKGKNAEATEHTRK